MKRIIEVEENAGLESLMGEVITLFCANYHYTGKLIGVNDKFVLLKEPSIVYETGPFNEPEWKDAQRLPKDEWYVMMQSIESFGLMK